MGRRGGERTLRIRDSATLAAVHTHHTKSLELTFTSNVQDKAREVFLAKQAAERKEKWVMGNWLFFRMHK